MVTVSSNCVAWETLRVCGAAEENADKTYMGEHQRGSETTGVGWGYFWFS